MSSPLAGLADSSLAHISRVREKAIAQHTSHLYTQRDNERNIAGWNAELLGRVHVFNDTLDRFLEDFVPSRERYPPLPRLDNLFHAVPNQKGREPQMYEPLVDAFRALVRNFPAAKRLAFLDNNDQPIKFPYALYEDEHHLTKPDIIVSLPGKRADTLKPPRWRNISMVFEVKAREEDDPIGKSGDKHLATMVQLAKTARNLLVAQRALSVCIIGIYGHRARILRFDRASAVVSLPFDYVLRPDILRNFLWRFVHPVSTLCNVLGADPSLQMPTPEDINWATKMCKDHMGIEFGPDNRVACCWIISKAENGTETRYLTFKLLYINPRLFSRATMVFEAFQEGDSSGRTFILKESWRQLARLPETQFYADIEAGARSRSTPTVKDSDEEVAEGALLFGVANLIFGVDLGEQEIAELNLQSQDHADDPDSETSSILSDLTELSGSIHSQSADDESTVSNISCQFGHRTISASVEDENNAHVNERSHMRLLFSSVGRPLDSFKNTKEMVAAMRDAILGHRQAYEAGVLHRDVHEGNILIAGNSPFRGFISDFDCGFNWRRLLELGQRERTLAEWQDFIDSKGCLCADTQQLLPLHAAELQDGLIRSIFKERTGTSYFMSIALLEARHANLPIIHEARHDLESFYWLLVWLILRYTAHDHHRKALAADTVFGSAGYDHCAANKRSWLTMEQITIQENRPLTTLLRQLTQLFFQECIDKTTETSVTTHAKVLSIFDEVLAFQDWPTDDAAIPFKPPKPIQQNTPSVPTISKLPNGTFVLSSSLHTGRQRKSQSLVLLPSGNGGPLLTSNQWPRKERSQRHTSTASHPTGHQSKLGTRSKRSTGGRENDPPSKRIRRVGSLETLELD